MNENQTQTQTVVIERDLPHAPEKVWRALTESSLIQQWLMETDFKPEAGRDFTLRMAPHGDWNGVVDCKVISVEPYTHLAYSWATLGLETIVNFSLTETGEGTHLKLEQSGFPVENQAAFKGATYGWTSFLTKLDAVVAGLN